MVSRVDRAGLADFYPQHKPEVGPRGVTYTVEDSTLKILCPTGENKTKFSICNGKETIIVGDHLEITGYPNKKELIVYGHGNTINGREIGNETENTKIIIDAASEKQKFELPTVTAVGNGSKPTETSSSVKSDKNKSDSDIVVSIPVAFSRKGNADTEVKRVFVTLFEAKRLNEEVKTKDDAGTIRLNELEPDKDGYVTYDSDGDGKHDKKLNINLPMLQKKLEEINTTPVKTPDAEKLELKVH